MKAFKTRDDLRRAGPEVFLAERLNRLLALITSGV